MLRDREDLAIMEAQVPYARRGIRPTKADATSKEN